MERDVTALLTQEVVDATDRAVSRASQGRSSDLELMLPCYVLMVMGVANWVFNFLPNFWRR